MAVYPRISPVYGPPGRPRGSVSPKMTSAKSKLVPTLVPTRRQLAVKLPQKPDEVEVSLSPGPVARPRHRRKRQSTSAHPALRRDCCPPVSQTPEDKHNTAPTAPPPHRHARIPNFYRSRQEKVALAVPVLTRTGNSRPAVPSFRRIFVNRSASRSSRGEAKTPCKSTSPHANRPRCPAQRPTAHLNPLPPTSARVRLLGLPAPGMWWGKPAPFPVEIGW